MTRCDAIAQKSNGLTVNKTSHHFGNEGLRMRGWRLAIMGMMTLVVAFTVSVTLPLRPTVSSTSPIAVAMITENDRKLPTDRPDYGLVEHGIHCLGHAVVRNAVAMTEPFRVHKAAYYLTDLHCGLAMVELRSRDLNIRPEIIT
jgi:hypothetical protein